MITFRTHKTVIACYQGRFLDTFWQYAVPEQVLVKEVFKLYTSEYF